MTDTLLNQVYATKDARDHWRSVAVCLASQIVSRDLAGPVRSSLAHIADDIEIRAIRYATEGRDSLAASLRREAGRYREAVNLIDSLTAPRAHADTPTTDR